MHLFFLELLFYLSAAELENLDESCHDMIDADMDDNPNPLTPKPMATLLTTNICNNRKMKLSELQKTLPLKLNLNIEVAGFTLICTVQYVFSLSKSKSE